MWNKPSNTELSKVPRLYTTDKIPLREKIIRLHFFIGDCDWYIVECDGDDLMFGFAILNNDLEMAEWGYVSLSELASINVRGIEIDRDLYWTPKEAGEVPKICKAQRWTAINFKTKKNKESFDSPI